MRLLFNIPCFGFNSDKYDLNLFHKYGLHVSCQKYNLFNFEDDGDDKMDENKETIEKLKEWGKLLI